MDTAILQALEKIRCPFLDAFFSVFTALGEEFIIAAIIAVVYICFSKRTGEQALLTVLTASGITAGLKGAVRRLRPYMNGDVPRVEIDNALVSTTDLIDDQSFPSGHATCTSGFFSTLALRVKKPLMLTASILFVLLVCLSRMYFGVHYPTDVLTGLVIGIGCAFLWQLLYAKCYNIRLYIFAGIALATLPLLFIERTATHSMFQMSAVMLAVALGLLIDDRWIRFEDTHDWLHRLLRLLIIIAVALIPFALFQFLLPKGDWMSFLKYFITLSCAMTAAPFLYKKLKI